jgi:chitin synthase
MPSTLANVMDLLGDYKRVIRNNDDISIFYIVYQIMMLIGTVLGPGSIFIMLAGSFGAAFGLDNWTSFLLNLIPLMFFIIACLTAKTDHQILFAQLLSVMYALVMMAVLIGILIQVAEDGWLAPTSLSLMFVAFAFIFAGLIHPQELACLPMGVIYYITIPSMYLFLVIYSVFNLNVVSWGTREVPKKMTLDEKEAEQVQAEADAKKKELKQKGTFLGSLFGKDNSSLEFSMRNLFHGQVIYKSRLNTCEF